jgi:HK97 family phage major capsid protein
MSNILELQEQRSKIVADQRAILDTADKENKGVMTEEQDVRYNKFEAEDVALGKRIEREEALEARQSALDAKEGAKLNATPEQRKAIETDEEISKRKSAAFEKYLRGGFASMDKEERNSLGTHTRAQSAGTTTEGGFTVPTFMADQIEQALLSVSGARQLGNVMKTSGGEQIDFPTNNDTGNVGVLLAENAQVGEQDLVFASVPLNAYTYTSKLIRVSNQLIEDSKFDIMSYIANAGAERIGRGTNAAFTTGDGSAKPAGFITGATSGKTTAGATAITFDELIDLEHSVDPAYRRMGSMGAKFTFNDATFAYIKKLKNTDGDYLWSAPNGRDGAPGTILGYEYAINQSMASIATTAKTVAFGDFSKFMIRDAGTPLILRLSERYADYNQTAFVMFTRHDSVLVDAGTKPVKYLTQA